MLSISIDVRYVPKTDMGEFTKVFSTLGREAVRQRE